MDEKQKFELGALLRFDRMLTPVIINLVYLLSMFGIVLSAIGFMFDEGVVAGLCLLIFGGLFVRIMCELLIVLFQINSNIQKIADRT